MNPSNQNSKPDDIHQPRSDSSRINERAWALTNPPTSFRWMIWLAAFVLLFWGTSSVRADSLPNNFWPDPFFESGTNLDQTDGTLTNWNRGGSDITICQVITNNSVSSGHSLACIDANGSGYGEWYADVTLGDHASPGDALDIQWYEMYNLDGPEMRLTVLFFNASDPDHPLTQTHFVTTDTSSAGWVSTIADSTFTKRNGSVAVPLGAVRMRCSLVSGGSETLTGVMVIDDLSVAHSPAPNLPSGNFWVNPSFELGSNLDQTNGTPSNWNRGGSDTTICQVTTNNHTSSTHALALVDPSSPTKFGEWYSDVSLSGNASPGDVVNIQWFEMFNIADGEMRLTVRFLDAMDNGPDNHFVVSGQSAGWQGSIEGSSFVRRNQSLTVPAGAVKMRIALVSGGPEATTGVFLIDDLSVAVVPHTVLAGNFFPNPTFELGDFLDNPTSASPAGGWSRGGSDASIDQVTTNNSVSPGHSLSLVDNNESGYGEWYVFLTLSGVAEGDVLDLRWFQLYSVTNGSMRLSFAFTDAGDAQLENHDYNVTDQSPGWLGSIATSPFERRSERLLVPAGTVKLRVNLASGGAANVVGTMLIDDLSVRLGKLEMTEPAPQAGGFDLTWFSVPGKAYTVQFAAALASPTDWIPLTTNLVSGGLSTSYSDRAIHGGNGGFYRVIQE